jgi:hypothetical protein
MPFRIFCDDYLVIMATLWRELERRSISYPRWAAYSVRLISRLKRSNSAWSSPVFLLGTAVILANLLFLSQGVHTVLLTIRPYTLVMVCHRNGTTVYHDSLVMA